jgi:hypothetical protein
MEKSTFCSKKGPPKTTFLKIIQFFKYFLSPEALSYPNKVQISQKRKQIRLKSAKKVFLNIFEKKNWGGMTF